MQRLSAWPTALSLMPSGPIRVAARGSIAFRLLVESCPVVYVRAPPSPGARCLGGFRVVAVTAGAA